MDQIQSIYKCGAWPRCVAVEFDNGFCFHSGDIENMRPSEIDNCPNLRGE